MKILIIEDEPLVAKDLQKRIKLLEPKAEVLEILSSVEHAKRWFEDHAVPDLIFSDIQLSDGISFEIFESLHLHCPIIFTTAYDEYAIRAFKLNSIDYLLKPIDAKELESAFVKYRSLSVESLLSDQVKLMISQWNGHVEKKYKERFLALHRNTLVPVGQNQVGYFHKEELIYLVTVENERYISEHQTLDEIETLLNPDIFFRVNRQYIIHVRSVDRIKTTHKGLTVQLKSPLNVEIDISREKATAFKKWVG
ncbi:MAG TPA: LytTR family DNA-binding domain-containing protein [Cyclobacteriaceae bacterium]|nr:LytTR family DNA-binding domain-containing protein [Cyclobacteriaceae bacterium]